MVWILGWKQGIFFWKILGCGSDWHFFHRESSCTMINQWIFGLRASTAGAGIGSVLAQSVLKQVGVGAAPPERVEVWWISPRKNDQIEANLREFQEVWELLSLDSLWCHEIFSHLVKKTTRWFLGMRFFRPSTGYCGTRVNPSHLTFASRSWRLSFLNSFNVFPMIWRQASFGVRWSRHLLLPRCQRSLPA